ncbi:MAG TPA: hypothetical protein VG722_07885, partial [Tepidisphaeraceae bacterium]|nr:hypothetical protein [Tepidisphaeraceae bacterium]
DGQLTVWAVNHGDGEARTTFDGLGASRGYHIFLWNARGNGDLSDGGIVHSNKNGMITMKLPFQSVIAITTMPASLGNAKH